MAVPAAVLSKVCSKCGEAKPVSEFRPRKGSRDGLHGWCHRCYNDYYSAASRRWNQANRERRRASARGQYWRDPEGFRARKRERDEADREQVNARAREYQKRSYVGERRARRLDRMHRRRVATKTTPVLAEYIAGLLQEQCVYCGCAERIEIDHVVPLSRGGKHEADNLAPACRTCNRSKKDHLLSEWPGRVVR